MADGIFHIRADGTLCEMQESEYVTEDFLQELLAKHPTLMSGRQIDPANPRRWLLIDREVTVPDQEAITGGRWSLDHLFLDQDAIPTLVEVKRSTDTRSRREVVAQMLDYAANASVYWPPGRIRAEYERRCSAEALDPLATLVGCLGVDTEVEAFWQRVDRNLRDGQIRLLFIADEISPELQRIVEFLNGQMDRTEVLALEVRQYVGGMDRTIVPRVIGRIERTDAKIRTGAKAPSIDRMSFMERVTELGDPNLREVMSRFLDWADARPDVQVAWSSQTFGIRCPKLLGRPTLLTVWPNGGAFFSMQGISKVPPFDDVAQRRLLADRLETDCHLKLAKLDQFPGVQLAALSVPLELTAFLAILEWVLSGGGLVVKAGDTK